MNRKNQLVTVWVLLLALVLTACSGGNAGAGGYGEGSKRENEMNSKLEQVNDRSYRYTLYNGTDQPVTYEFSSGQRYDFVLIDSEGNTAFRFAAVSSFVQAIGEETIAGGEELSYDLEVPPLDLEAGEYTMKAWLTPVSGPVLEAEAEFTAK